jgi:ELWxxDGT repeat protein
VSRGGPAADADDVKHGNELWKSDGTKAGTVLVKDIWPGKRSSRPVWHLFVGRIFYFRANDGAHGVEPWRSDGTKAGTTLVADIYPGTRGSFPTYFTNLRGTAFVGAREPFDRPGAMEGSVVTRVGHDMHISAHAASAHSTG